LINRRYFAYTLAYSLQKKTSYIDYKSDHENPSNASLIFYSYSISVIIILF
jgi:hypothetical protein